jgi:iron-sulfur cluster repair protein YtfE (RIC family)
MSEDASWLYHEHLDLEELIDDCATAVRRGDWETAARLFGRLVGRLKGHMRIEEEVIFPAYEGVAGTAREPTASLRNDHDAMVRWCRDLHYSLQARNEAAFAGALKPLRDLLAHHDEKEEQVFLPMAGYILRDRRQEVLDRLKELGLRQPPTTGRVWDF